MPPLSRLKSPRATNNRGEGRAQCRLDHTYALYAQDARKRYGRTRKGNSYHFQHSEADIC